MFKLEQLSCIRIVLSLSTHNSWNSCYHSEMFPFSKGSKCTYIYISTDSSYIPQVFFFSHLLCINCASDCLCFRQVDKNISLWATWVTVQDLFSTLLQGQLALLEYILLYGQPDRKSTIWGFCNILVLGIMAQNTSNSLFILKSYKRFSQDWRELIFKSLWDLNWYVQIFHFASINGITATGL